MYYNDYEQTIKSYLRRHTEFTVYLQNLQARMDELQYKLNLNAAPKTTRYTPDSGGGGGWDKPSPEEAALEQREEMRKNLQDLKREFDELAPLMQCLNRSIDALDETERDMVRRHGIMNESWKSIASDTYLEERSCRRRYRNGLRKLAGMMFGPHAAPEKETFVFLKNCQ